MYSTIQPIECKTAADVWAAAAAVRQKQKASRMPPAPEPEPEKPQIIPIEAPPDSDFARLVAAAYPARYPGELARLGVSVKAIQAAVSEASGVRVTDLISARRTANVVLPRQIAMALAKHFTLKSLPEIGRRFGGRDHTTVLHACRKMEPVIEAVAARVPEGSTLEAWVAAALETAPSMNLITSYQRRKTGAAA